MRSIAGMRIVFVDAMMFFRSYGIVRAFNELNGIKQNMAFFRYAVSPGLHGAFRVMNA